MSLIIPQRWLWGSQIADKKVLRLLRFLLRTWNKFMIIKLELVLLLL